MILDKNKNFIFIHNPRTAGTSITSVLNNLNDEHFLNRHRVYPEAFLYKRVVYDHNDHINLDFLDSRVLKDFKFKFTIVRNPFDRIISYFLKINKFLDYAWWKPDLNDLDKFDIFIEKIFQKRIFDYGGDFLFMSPQLFWTHSVDKFFKFENLSNDIRTIIHKCDLASSVRVPHLNKSPHSVNKLNYFFRDQKNIQKVYDSFYNDFKYLNYSYPVNR